ncbi:hypothetical protein H2198_002224 [Neophaeococcomyces mojaviensis]|uniref:Uncharacterized protein n=1 Tax=Neophaeococcomyces mojaviensis TaxID=3383035 RepID=A0ACC3AFF0_9EURO|nr:hypothetical protein H2198_002224 [Knufia sp. JES_112]
MVGYIVKGAIEERGCTVEELQAITQAFLHDIDFKPPTEGYDASFIKDVIQHFEGLPVLARVAKRIRAIAEWVSAGVGISYPFLRQSNLRDIAIFTTYLFIIDDYGEEMTTDLQSFTTLLVSGKRQSNVILGALVEFLPSLKAHYGPFAYDMFVKSTIEFVNGCILELRLDQQFETPAHATSFPRYFRLKTGYADPYAHFLFSEEMWAETKSLHQYLPCIPDLVNFINHVNDLLSFYKESIIGQERFNYVYNHARAQCVSPATALRDTAESTLSSIRNVREVLKQEPGLLRHVDRFVCGFITYHILCPRYHLGELGILSGDMQRIVRIYEGMDLKVRT